MVDDSLIWRMEALYTAAWPPLRTETHGDWLLKFAPGVSRRANSANPLRAQIANVDATIAHCEGRYRGQGVPALFRILSTLDPVAGLCLDRLGYKPEGETVNLYAPMDEAVARPDEAVTILDRPSGDWLDVMTAAQGHTGERKDIYRRMVGAISVPVAFVALRQEDRLAALGYGAMNDGLLCLESVVTVERYRGRGLAYRAMSALMHWGRMRGARAVCLQVEDTNERAKRLYYRLGLTHELYRYDYRREPGAATYTPPWMGKRNDLS